MKLAEKEFRRQLQQYIQFRGIDIVLYLKDGSVLELDKNRQMEGDLVIKNGRDGIERSIHLNEILKVDFYAA